MSRLILLAGPSGVGKTTLVRKLTEDTKFERVVTCTTRGPRGGEVPGVDYNFMSYLDFKTLEESGRLLEAAQVHNHRYGTERDAVLRILEAGRTPILITDVQGVEAILRQDKLKTFSIFLRFSEPWRAAMYVQLKGRGDLPQETIEARMAQAENEMRMTEMFDIQVVNKDLDRTVETLRYVLGSNRG